MCLLEALVLKSPLLDGVNRSHLVCFIIIGWSAAFKHSLLNLIYASSTGNANHTLHLKYIHLILASFNCVNAFNFFSPTLAHSCINFPEEKVDVAVGIRIIINAFLRFLPECSVFRVESLSAFVRCFLIQCFYLRSEIAFLTGVRHLP